MFVRPATMLAALVLLFIAALAQAADPPYKQTQNIVYAEVHGIGLVLDVFAPTGKSNGLGLVDVASGSFLSLVAMMSAICAHQRCMTGDFGRSSIE